MLSFFLFEKVHKIHFYCEFMPPSSEGRVSNMSHETYTVWLMLCTVFCHTEVSTQIRTRKSIIIIVIRAPSLQATCIQIKPSLKPLSIPPCKYIPCGWQPDALCQSNTDRLSRHHHAVTSLRDCAEREINTKLEIWKKKYCWVFNLAETSITKSHR